METDRIMPAGNYDSPSLICLEMKVENGFAQSGGETENVGTEAPYYIEGFNF